MTMASSVRRIAPVSTMVEPVERQRVDAAGAGLYRTIHRNSIAEVLCDLKERRISAVIVSVGRCVREEPSQMAAVVRAFPGIPTLALLSSAGDTSAETVLTLGNCGIRTLIDVRKPEGWGRLRALLGREATKDADRLVLAALRGDLCDVPDDCWRFFEALFSPEFRVSTVRQLARQLNVLPSTLMSRFFRARLPAPKRYLAFARLIRAARLFENPGLSISDVANHLDYSSPQSFGRHVRTVLHITAGEFRCMYDGERMLDRFRHELIQPNLTLLRRLHPLAVRSGMRVVPSSRSFTAPMQSRLTAGAACGRAVPPRAQAI
jgi:AraC-like DNA-binding protein